MEHSIDRVALIDASTSEQITHNELSVFCTDFQESLACLGDGKRLIFFYIRNKIKHAKMLLALVDTDHAIALLDPHTEVSLKANQIERYAPDLILGDIEDLDFLQLGGYADSSLNLEVGLKALSSIHFQPPLDMTTGLSVLMSTSGTTGSPKFVKLSRRNLSENCKSIIVALGISVETRALAHLKMHYSYGLSVLMTHIKAGGSIVLTEDPISSTKFWSAIRDNEVRSFPGVAFHYEYISKFNLRRFRVPSLSIFTQAGGRCDPKILLKVKTQVGSASVKLYVMYGQTEAAPRIATLPSDNFEENMGSVGFALENGKIEVWDKDQKTLPANEIGEVVYFGPNVMLGYAHEREDLNLSDSMEGKLRTGDLGYLDDNTNLWITGRLARFAKVHGLRIGLDEIEAHTADWPFPCLAVEGDNQVYCVTDASEREYGLSGLTDKANTLNAKLNLPLKTIVTRRVDKIPRKVNGKPDYVALKRAVDV